VFLSQLLSKVTATICSFAPNVQCLAAGRRTLKMCCIEVVLFSVVAFTTLTFHTR